MTRKGGFYDWNKPENSDRLTEISRHVQDSGDDNTGVDPQTGLVFIRDGGNGLFSY